MCAAFVLPVMRRDFRLFHQQGDERKHGEADRFVEASRRHWTSSIRSTSSYVDSTTQSNDDSMNSSKREPRHRRLHFLHKHRHTRDNI